MAAPGVARPRVVESRRIALMMSGSVRPEPYRRAAPPATCGEANEVPVSPRVSRFQYVYRCSTTVMFVLPLPAATATMSGFLRPAGDGPGLEKFAMSSSEMVAGSPLVEP